MERHTLPESLRQLSTRHIDLDDRGRIWFACQYEGPRNDLPPLVGHFSRGEALTFLSLPEETTIGLANYVGAIAVNRAENRIGITSPNGGRFVMLDGENGRVLHEENITDAAGIAAAAHGFAVSSYDGRFAGHRNTLAWDQHIASLMPRR
jgi:hypothetical protein